MSSLGLNGLGVGLRGEHDDGDGRDLADLTAHFESVLAREHEVEEDEIGSHLLELVEGLVAGRAEEGLEALALEHDSDHLGQGRVIINYEDTRVHTPIVAQSPVKFRP